MKKIYSLLLLVVSFASFGQILTENFNFPDNSLLQQELHLLLHMPQEQLQQPFKTLLQLLIPELPMSELLVLQAATRVLLLTVMC